MITATQRFDIYLQYFIDGNVSLDYLKGIIVRDKILKTEIGKSLNLFPLFLITDGDVTENIYDDTTMNVNSVAIKLTLTSVITYIQTSLFAQDIALLNDMAKRFEKSIGINTDSNTRLQSELAKLSVIEKDLNSQLLEAKKVYIAYDIVMSQYANSPDPVRAYIDNVTIKINTELATQSAIKDQLEAQASAKLIADQKESDLALQLQAQQVAQKEILTKQQANAETEQAKQDQIYKDNLVKGANSQAITESKTSTTPATPTEEVVATKSSKALPIIAGIGVLAYLGLKD
jgi:hypothetical protein